MERGAVAWPRLVLPAPVFLPHLALRLVVEPGETVLAALQAIHAEDLYLACGCAQGQTAAIQHFDSYLSAELPAMLRQLRLSQAALQEVQQLARVKLLVGSASTPPKIGSYSGRGSLLSWLRVVTLRIALDERRREEQSQAAPSGIDRQAPEQLIAGAADPHLDYIKAHYRQQFQEALQFGLSCLDAEQRNLLRLHYFDGLNLDALKGLFHVHRATVARRLIAARRELLVNVRRHLQERAGLSAAETDSIARLLHSQIRLSIHRFLGDLAEKPPEPHATTEPSGAQP